MSLIHNIPNKHFFKYLQLRSFISCMQNQSLAIPPLSSLEEIITKNCNSNGLISLIYNWLASGSSETSIPKLVEWRADLKEDISDDDWSTICKQAQTQTANTNLKLIQYKWLMRTYTTPVKLNKYNSIIPDTCFKCNEAQGTLIHCIWECKKIGKFWREVTDKIATILSVNIPLNSKMILLHLHPTDLKLRTKEYAFIDFAILQAKRVIAFNWKKTDSPTIGVWIENMAQCMSLERITYILKNKLEVYEEIWKPFSDFIKKGDIGKLLQERNPK